MADPLRGGDRLVQVPEQHFGQGGRCGQGGVPWQGLASGEGGGFTRQTGEPHRLEASHSARHWENHYRRMWGARVKRPGEIPGKKKPREQKQKQKQPREPIFSEIHPTSHQIPNSSKPNIQKSEKRLKKRRNLSFWMMYTPSEQVTWTINNK